MHRWLLTLTTVLLLASSPAPATPPNIEDVLLTIKARQLLYRDEELKPYNVGVQVVGRVAILFGPVPSLEMGLRAESRLRDLIELRDVRNELEIVTPLPELLPQRIPAPSPQPGLEKRQPPRPGTGAPAELSTPRPTLTLREPITRQSRL